MTASTAQVTAVILAREHSGGMVEAIRSVLAQRRKPERLILVTDVTVAEDQLKQVATECIDADFDAWHHLVHPEPSQHSLAQALHTVLTEHFPESQKTKAAHSWLWFATGTTIAHELALGELLNETEISPTVTIAGAKQVEADNFRRLRNVGLTVSHPGEILSLIDSGELDQGQYDSREDMFAVDTPGMLIRYDMWRDLDGFDRHTPVYARAVDLCWRARLAGARVVVVPSSIVSIVQIQHHQYGGSLSAGSESTAEAEVRAAKTGQLPVHTEHASVGTRQEAATWLRLKHRSAWTVPVMWVWSLISAFGIFLGSLILKAPGVGAARAGGILRTLTRPIALAQSRSAASNTRVAPYTAVDELRPAASTVREFRRQSFEMNQPVMVIGDGTGTNTSEHQPTGGHDDFAALATPERSWVGLGLVVAVVLMAVVSVLGMLNLMGATSLGGGALRPVAGSLTELFHAATTGWAPAGVGAAGHAGPAGWLLVLAGLTGSANIFIAVLYVLAMPLAAAGAWTMVGAITRSRATRFVLALVWGLAPVLVTSLGEGRIFAVVVHLTLPWLGLAIIRATGHAVDRRIDPEGQRVEAITRPGHHGVPSWTASGWTALLFAVIAVASPIVLVPGTLLLLVMAALARQRGRALWWTPLLAWTLYIPAILSHWNNPRALLADPGVPLGYTPGTVLDQLLGFPQALDLSAGLASLPWLERVTPGAPWALIAVLLLALPVLVLAVIGAFTPTRNTGAMARTGLLVSSFGLLTGALAAQIMTTVDSTGASVYVYTGPAVSVAALGFVVAAASGLDTLRAVSTKIMPAAVVVMLMVAVVAAGLWLTPRLAPGEAIAQERQEALIARQLENAEADPALEPLHARWLVDSVPATRLPATAADRGAAEVATNTLLIERTSDGLRTNVISGAGDTLEELTGTWTGRALTGSLLTPTLATPDAADEETRSAAASLTSGTAADPREQLHRLGVAFVVLHDDATGSEAATASALDSVTGLTPVGLTEAGWLWRVAPATETSTPLVSADGAHTELTGLGTAAARIVDENLEPVWFLASDTDGSVHVELPEATDKQDQELVLSLAERADPGFHASLNGEPLEALPAESVTEWNQRFSVPASGGTLSVSYNSPMPGWLWLLPGLALGIALLLAVPSPAHRFRRSEARSEQGVARGHRNAGFSGATLTSGDVMGEDIDGAEARVYGFNDGLQMRDQLDRDD